MKLCLLKREISTTLSADVLSQNENHLTSHPLALLPREDLDLITQLVLKHASLKDLAAEYDVSYPTIKLRFDRVVARVEQAVAGRPPDPLTELLATLVDRGEVTGSAARSIRDLVQKFAPTSTKGGAP